MVCQWPCHEVKNILQFTFINYMNLFSSKKKKKLYEFVLLCMQCHIKSNKFRVLEIKSNKLPVDCSVIQ